MLISQSTTDSRRDASDERPDQKRQRGMESPVAADFRASSAADFVARSETDEGSVTAIRRESAHIGRS
jgi:hypothetical protein